MTDDIEKVLGNRPDDSDLSTESKVEWLWISIFVEFGKLLEKQKNKFRNVFGG